MATKADEPDWEAALWGEDHGLLQKLIDTEAPPTVSFQLERHIRQLHMVSNLTPGRIDPEDAGMRIRQLAAVLPDLRGRIGGWVEQRAYDLSVLQWIRRNSALFVVLGAGATIDAGGPSWPGLVQRLLEIALETGKEIIVYDPIPGGTESPTGTELDEFPRRAQARVDRVERLDPKQEREARRLLSQIKAGSTDTEMLMRGAQVCADLFKETLFQQITVILYPGGELEPSPIHRAIARLAHWQEVPGGGATAGWVSVVNYNFDSLMSDALEAEQVPYTFLLMRDDEISRHHLKRDPNPDASLPIIHVHGFTPRQPFFDLRGVRFVFSTQQFETLYGEEEPTIISLAVHRYISHPAHVALYVGCSFTDEAMNSVLRDAAQRFPARMHYALLELPEDLRENDDQAILERETRRYVEIGVRPVWFSDFKEIPALIDRLV